MILVLALLLATTCAAADLKLNAGIRARVIDGALTNLTQYYVFPETAAKMAEAIRAHQRNRDYDSVTDGTAFASLLTSHLREISHDKHLAVRYSDGSDGALLRRPENGNCLFQKSEILSSNIGYVKFNGFLSPGVCGPAASDAMAAVAQADAIIFDLRENGGGDPAMVAYISSYLFDKPTHLNDLYNRVTNTTQEFWTRSDIPGKRLAGKPAFVLTSHYTFSGAEEFTYNLKNLKRATIIGEVTGGGAHPVAPHRIDDHFTIGVPFARAINPITKTNWEGAGVEPDIKVPASEALDVALKMAVKK